jgi:hypothetical protein
MIHPMRVRMPFSLPSSNILWIVCWVVPNLAAASPRPGHYPIATCRASRTISTLTLFDMYPPHVRVSIGVYSTPAPTFSVLGLAFG